MLPMGALGGAPVVRYTERACWSRVRARWRGTHHRRRRNADTVTQRDGSREASQWGISGGQWEAAERRVAVGVWSADRVPIE